MKMRDFVLDLTPTAINRTAIYHIANDTANEALNRVGGFRYGSQVKHRPLADHELSKLKNQILRTIFSDQLTSSSTVRPITSSASRTFYFDPLYVLFGSITASDVVLVLDLTPITNPEWHDGHISRLYETAFRKALSSGAKICSISRNTAEALYVNFGLPADNVTVIPLYLRRGAWAASEPAAKRDKTLLFVGSLETRKNISGLIRAFSASKLSASGYQLTIVGGDGKGAEQIRDMAKATPGVRLTGYVSDAELAKLYRTSRAFVYPSFLEGFGVPLLEAAAAGLPILTSTTGAPPENAPPGSILIDPHEPAELVEGLRAIARLSDDEILLASNAGIAHAEKFTFSNYYEAFSKAFFET